jgi:hypothetical protein
VGLAASGALAISGSALATLLVARHFHGAPPLASLALALARAALAALVAAAAARWIQPGRPGALGALLDLAAGGAVFVAVATATVAVAADGATREAWLGLLARTLRRARRDSR